MRCPECDHSTDMPPAAGEGMARCPECGVTIPLNLWLSDRPKAVANTVPKQPPTKKRMDWESFKLTGAVLTIVGVGFCVYFAFVFDVSKEVTTLDGGRNYVANIDLLNYRLLGYITGVGLAGSGTMFFAAHGICELINQQRGNR